MTDRPESGRQSVTARHRQPLRLIPSDPQAVATLIHELEAEIDRLRKALDDCRREQS